MLWFVRHDELILCSPLCPCCGPSPGRSDNTGTAGQGHCPECGAGRDDGRAWSWHSLVPSHASSPTHIFPSSHPASAAQPHTNCFTVRKPPPVPGMVITTFISLSSKYHRDTQNVWLGMWFTVTLPGSVWWWDHDRSDHWANIVFPVTMWDTGRSCVTSEPCHPQCDTFHITDVMTFLSHVAKSLNDGDILFLYPLRTFLCHLKTLHSHYLYGDLWWKRSTASPLFPSQDCWNTQIPGPTSI